MKIKLNFLSVVLIVGLIAVLTFSNSLHNEFMIDDYAMFLENPIAHNVNFLHFQLIPDQDRYLSINQQQSNAYYRPVVHVLPMICYLLFKENPFGYHVVNLVLFVLCCSSIYFIIQYLFRNKGVALLTSILYCVHPINGMFVNYITASVFAVQVLAMIWCCYLFCLLQESKKFSLWFLSFSCCLLALLCHETALAMPFYLLAVALFAKGYRMKKAIMISLPYFVFVFAFFLTRLKYASLKESIFDKMGLVDLSFFEYIASFTNLLIWYFSKFFWFEGIVFLWSMAPVQDNILLWNILFFGLLISLVGLLFYKKQKSAMKLGLAWTLIGCLPVTFACMFHISRGFMIEPHWFFFSSIGFFFLGALFLLKILELLQPKIRMGIIAFVLGILIIVSRSYNVLWSDEREYTKHWLKESPSLKGVNFYLANAYMRHGQNELARQHYQKSIENNFFDWQIYTNLGLMDYFENNFNSAKSQFERAYSIYPNSTVTLNNLGLVHWKLGERGQANAFFTKAIETNRFYLEPQMNLASLHAQNGYYDQAIKVYKNILTLNANNHEATFGLLKAYLALGQKENVARLIDIPLRKGKDVRKLVQLGSLFAENYLYDTAFLFFERARSLDPFYGELYLELGKAYGNLEKFDFAIQVWEEGKRVDPNDHRFDELISKAKELKIKIKSKI